MLLSICVLSEAKSERRLQMQVAYLEVDPRKQQHIWKEVKQGRKGNQ
jgi:Holliday junction resolvase-like predicted endonuclease